MRTYSILTWDSDAQCYTPQEGLTVACLDVPLSGVRAALKELRESHGYTCHRRRTCDGRHDCNDSAVLVERTDGEIEV